MLSLSQISDLNITFLQFFVCLHIYYYLCTQKYNKQNSYYGTEIENWFTCSR